MREIVLDTETTGFDPATGDRIIEIGCVELFDHFPTGKTLQFYLNPERDVPIETTRVHGITTEMLKDKPLFAAVVDEILEFLGDAPLVIHNASFDMKFLNAELTRVNRPTIHISRAIDTIEIAKRKIPGVRYSLDELCKRFNIDISARTKHGALLDADLTAQLYLELLGGRQQRLVLAPIDSGETNIIVDMRKARARPQSLASLVTEAEQAAHAAFIAKEIGEAALWKVAET